MQEKELTGIGDFLWLMDKKINALKSYKSQISSAPSRSLDATLSLAKFRGSQNGCKYAEAFKVIRIII